MTNQEKREKTLKQVPPLDDKKKVVVNTLEVADPSIYLHLKTQDGGNFDEGLVVAVAVIDSQNNTYNSSLTILDPVTSDELKLIVPFGDGNFSNSSSFSTTVTVSSLTNDPLEVVTPQPIVSQPVERFAVDVVNNLPIPTPNSPQKHLIFSNLNVANSTLSFILETDDGTAFDSKLKIIVDVEDSQNNTFNSKITTGNKIVTKSLNVLIPFGLDNTIPYENFTVKVKVKFLDPTGTTPYETPWLVSSDYCLVGDYFEVKTIALI